MNHTPDRIGAASGSSPAGEGFMSSDMFMHAINSKDWDMLVQSGTGSSMENREDNKWARESLYRKFDPLIHYSPALVPVPSIVQNGGTPYGTPPRAPQNLLASSNNNTPTNRLENHPLERTRRQLEGERSESPGEPKNNTGPLISIFTPLPPPPHSYQTVAPVGESDLSGFGVPLSEAEGDAMSPSLSSNCIDMNGTSVETLIKEALAEQELTYQAVLAEKDNQLKELETKLSNLTLQEEKQNRDDSLNRVLSEYEKTMSVNIQYIDELKQKLEDSENEKLHIIKERDQAWEDLRNVESAFSDVHRKYERAKNVLECNRKNEELLKQRDMEMLDKISNRDAKLEELKEKVKANLEQMHANYEGKQKALETDLARLRAQLRKTEMKVDTLEHDVEQKSREVAKLSGLCDELINEKIK